MNFKFTDEPAQQVKKRNKYTINKLRESQSLKTSKERRSNHNKSKIKVIKPRIEKIVRVGSCISKPNFSSNLNNSIKSTKVKMILERHRRMKKNQNTYRPSETMEDNRSKISALTNQQRRNKSRSNVSTNPEKENLFLNLTTESNTIGLTQERVNESLESLNINYEDEKRNTSHFELKENHVNEEEYNLEKEIEKYENSNNFGVNPNEIITESQYNPGDAVNKKDAQYKRNSDRFNPDRNEEEEFYMNAPCQLDINRLRGRVDLPPMTDNLVEVTSISK